MVKKKRYNLILIVLLPVLLLCLMGAVASIYQNIAAADDVFTIKGADSNYTTTAGGSLTVTRNVKKGNLPACDVIYWNDEGAKVENINFSGGNEQTLNINYTRAIVVPHYEYNAFVASEYDLRKLNNDWLYNETNGGTTDRTGDLIRGNCANIYLLNDVTLSDDLTLNFPFYMDLLGSKITGKTVTVEHDYAGDYRIDSTFKGGEITTLASRLSRGALYYFGNKQTNAEFSVLVAALDYANKRIPEYILSDVNFPVSYSTYPAYYSYKIDGESINADGDTTRGEQSREVTITVTVTYNGETDSREFTKTVVGTSAAAEGAYFQIMLAQKLENAYGIGATTSPEKMLNEQPLDLSVLCDELQESTVKTIEVSDGSFDWQDNKLIPKVHLAEDELKVICGGEAGTYTAPRSSDEAIAGFLDNQFPTPYFELKNAGRTAEFPLFGTADNTLTLPSDGETQMRYKYGDISFEYSFKDLTSNNVINPAFLSWDEEKDGVLQFNSATYRGGKTAVILTVTIGENIYNIEREIVISIGGFGGDNTSLQNADLAPFGGEALSSFSHSVSDMYIGIELLDESLGGYIGIEKTQSGGYTQTITLFWKTGEKNYPFLIIDNGANTNGSVPTGYTVAFTLENVPNFDVYLNLRVKMYYTADDKINDKEKTYRDVTLTVPGILYYNKTGYAPREFADVHLYNAIVERTVNGEEYDGGYVSDMGYGVFRVTDADKSVQYVLLAKGAGNGVNELNCKGKEITDLTGIQYLTGTRSFNLSNCTLNTLLPFSYFSGTNNAAERLILQKCGLTDEKIWDGDISYLYTLNRLQEVDLSGNQITAAAKGGNPIVYRTVTTLNLSSNLLTDVAGLENILKLQTLDISNNQINSFNDLKYCSALKTVYLYGNTSNIKNGYYGTNGSINIPVYVALHDKGVDIYHDSAEILLTFGENGDISETQTELARALNAVAYAKAQKGDIYFATTVTGGNGTSYNVTLVTVLQINGNTATLYDVGGSGKDTISFTGNNKPDGEIYLIASIIFGDVTVYSQYKMNYQGGT